MDNLSLPKAFEHVAVDGKSDVNVVLVRCNLRSSDDCERWLHELH